MHKPRTFACIFARGGSKGIPRKNLAKLHGRSLLAWAIERARSVPAISRVFVSTDDDEIAAEAVAQGAEVPFLRPAELAGDHSSEHLAWKHAVRELTDREGRFDVLVSLPTTSPLRSRGDVEKCIAMLLKYPDTDVVLTVQQASRNPYYNMVVLDADNIARIVIDGVPAAATRQAVPAVYDVTTAAYAIRPDFVLKSESLFVGRVRAVEIPRVRAIDIDNPLDLEWVEYLVKRGHPDLHL